MNSLDNRKLVLKNNKSNTSNICQSQYTSFTFPYFLRNAFSLSILAYSFPDYINKISLH